MACINQAAQCPAPLQGSAVRQVRMRAFHISEDEGTQSMATSAGWSPIADMADMGARPPLRTLPQPEPTLAGSKPEQEERIEVRLPIPARASHLSTCPRQPMCDMCTPSQPFLAHLMLQLLHSHPGPTSYMPKHHAQAEGTSVTTRPAPCALHAGPLRRACCYVASACSHSVQSETLQLKQHVDPRSQPMFWVALFVVGIVLLVASEILLVGTGVLAGCWVQPPCVHVCEAGCLILLSGTPVPVMPPATLPPPSDPIISISKGAVSSTLTGESGKLAFALWWLRCCGICMCTAGQCPGYGKAEESCCPFIRCQQTAHGTILLWF